MILVAAGATGGHLYPALALMAALNESAVFMVPREYPARDIIAPYGHTVHVVPMSVRRWYAGIGQVWRVIRIMRGCNPRLIVLMGGGICVPVAWLGRLLGYPMIAFEPNTIPGRAIRWIQRVVPAMITMFPQTASRLPATTVHCLGNPIVQDYPPDPRVEALPPLTGPVLVVIGGSQGAMALNTLIHTHRQVLMAATIHVIHVWGQRHFDRMAPVAEMDPQTQAYYLPLPYVTDMVALYKRATHVLCRSGATTIAELWSNGLPSLLVPFPYATDDHQRHNAMAFVASVGNADWVDESDLTIAGIQAFVEGARFKPQLPQYPAAAVRESICGFMQRYLQ
jgi:UDP-N-acetylglucosamine--N-acetylmuramyl-(pentapeptide) pyrophosphoryl-undecaprenol N-acetylglucosamine transferase